MKEPTIIAYDKKPNQKFFLFLEHQSSSPPILSSFLFEIYSYEIIKHAAAAAIVCKNIVQKTLPNC